MSVNKDKLTSYLNENIPIKFKDVTTQVQVYDKEKGYIKIPRESKAITKEELRKRMDTINLLVKLILKDITNGESI